MRHTLFTMGLLAAGMIAGAAVEYPAPVQPGAALATQSGNTYSLSNEVLTASYSWKDGEVRFDGLKAADGTVLTEGSAPVFTLKLATGQELSSLTMKAGEPKVVDLKGDAETHRLSLRLPGKAVTTTFTSPDGNIEVKWRALLRDGSHYVRNEYIVRAKKEVVPFNTITPLQVTPSAAAGTPSISGNTTHGTVAITDKLFMGLETPMSVMTVGSRGAEDESAWNAEKWTPGMFGSVFAVPDSFVAKYGKKLFAAKSGPVVRDLLMAEGPVKFEQGGKCQIKFSYTAGNHRLNMVGVQLVTASGQVISEDVHRGYTGEKHHNAVYTIDIPEPGSYQLRYYVEKKTEPVTSSGNISLSLPLAAVEETTTATPDNLVRGTWVRKTDLSPQAATPWRVSSVIGLFAPQQQRRSFLAYIEREKNAPYRPMVHYNDWYEVGIVLHDHRDPRKRTSEEITLRILNNWKKQLWEKRGMKLDAYVIDDGWDDFNSLWDFHVGFPNGFAKVDEVAKSMGCGLGTWLGPVGGYGASKGMRIAHWNKTHPQNRISNFELSNPVYFKAFVDRCSYMIKHYDMRYFKFDGISTKFHAKGPGALEDAEGILSVLAALRKQRPDIFINTTVGTWASPFWFLHADSIWRQENDFDQVGTMGDARDKWITYRDRLVHEVFVTGAPLFPINSLMTHGTIITKNGPPRVMSKDPANCVKEMRTAFTCGSGLQEIYADADLMNQADGVLWDELAQCIAWVRRNEDVLADTHWVGGNPWDRQAKDGDIYGWASWNGKKCTLSLRNSSNKEKTLRGTLRSILDIPPHVGGKVILRSSFDDQRKLPVMDKEIDVDAPVEFTIQPMEVIAMEGVCK